MYGDGSIKMLFKGLVKTLFGKCSNEAVARLLQDFPLDSHIKGKAIPGQALRVPGG
jgi:hypothetical protein